METDDLQAQLSQLQQLIADEEQKRQRQKVQILLCTFVFCQPIFYSQMLTKTAEALLCHFYLNICLDM